MLWGYAIDDTTSRDSCTYFAVNSSNLADAEEVNAVGTTFLRSHGEEKEGKYHTILSYITIMMKLKLMM